MFLVLIYLSSRFFQTTPLLSHDDHLQQVLTYMTESKTVALRALSCTARLDHAERKLHPWTTDWCHSTGQEEASGPPSTKQFFVNSNHGSNSEVATLYLSRASVNSDGVCVEMIPVWKVPKTENPRCMNTIIKHYWGRLLAHSLAAQTPDRIPQKSV